MVEIKNALLSGKAALTVDYSGYRENVLKVLKELGLLSFKIFKEEAGPFKKIEIELLDEPSAKRRLKEFRIFSRPGRRLYLSVSKIKAKLAKRPGAFVISTSKGVLEARSAVKQSLGGEIIFEV